MAHLAPPIRESGDPEQPLSFLFDVHVCAGCIDDFGKRAQSLLHAFTRPVSYTHLTLPTIYSV